ncbi:hypothetical protein [Desulfogranum marinum]|uniref:hypothetical protein n=1 Tax=Desulfogranum marinum TaxID=453220 RepID=UPI001962C1B4|nr:hypothetical protein [Desulfogranum marinum]MBM9514714.1 hypothetical protein [Desulfogranum marinum]
MMGVAYKPEDWFFLKSTGAAGSNGMDDTVCSSNISLLLSSHHRTKHTEPTTPLNHLGLFIAMVRREYKRNRYSITMLREKKPLSEFGIDQLSMTLNTNKLYRVFNNESFKQGGRFYGAPYQKMSEKVRSGILINGAPTVELDYSAHHIRLPYHLLGIDYQEDPYLALAESQEERDRMKKLLLIAMNAGSENDAIQGFRGAMRGKVAKGSGILSNENVRKLLHNAKKVHHRIDQYIHSGAGTMLQNLDSKITEAILLRMTKIGVPCLAIHDSYISCSKRARMSLSRQ